MVRGCVMDQISATNSSSNALCVPALISRPRIFSAPCTASAATWPRSSARARWAIFSMSAWAAAFWRAASASASVRALSTICPACWLARSMMTAASARAFFTSSSARVLASASSLRARSAASRPSAMRLARSSMAFMIGGQMYFIVYQTRIRKTMIWAMSVAFRLTVAILSRESGVQQGCRVRLRCSADGTRSRTHDFAEWVDEDQVQRDTHADDRDRVDQADQQEHLALQHRHQLGLARGTLEELAAHQTHADGGADAGEAQHEARSQGGEAFNTGQCADIHCVSP